MKIAVSLILKFFEENFEITRGYYRMPIKDVQEKVGLRPKLDVCG